MAGPLKTGSKVGQYCLEDQIGEGGAGAVFKARVEGLNRLVAIKILLPSLSKNKQAILRFKREAYAASQLNHPHIIPTYDFGELQGVYYIVMPFIDGGNLADVVVNGPIKIKEAVEIALQIGQGVAAAHEQGIIHRDIKPENILFHQGRALLTDFGLAFQEGMPSITMAGARIGTPMYMSPEQANGKPLDSQTDVYSLGVVLYEMVAGQPPFSMDLPATKVMAQIMQGKKIPLAEVDVEVPPDLEYIISKAIEASKENRYGTIRDFLMDLQKFSQGIPLEISSQKSPKTVSLKQYSSSRKKAFVPPPSRPKNNMIPVILLTLFCGIAIGFLIFYLNKPVEKGKRKGHYRSGGSGKRKDLPPRTNGTGTSPYTMGTGTGTGTGMGMGMGTGTGTGTNPNSETSTTLPNLYPPQNTNPETPSLVNPLFPETPNPPLGNNRWNTLWGGNWKIQGSEFLSQGKGFGPYGFSGLALLRKIRGFQMEVELQMSHGSPGNYGGIFIGSDPNNMILVYLCDSPEELKKIPPDILEKWKKTKGTPAKIIRLALFERGKWRALRDQLVSFSSQDFARLGFSLQKGILSIWVKGEKVGFNVKIGPRYDHLGFGKFFDTKMRIRMLNLRFLDNPK